jgi:hypothetical protein
MPDQRAAQLLSEFLPLSDRRMSPAAVRRHTLAVGEQLDGRLGGHFAWVARDPTSAREFMKALILVSPVPEFAKAV